MTGQSVRLSQIVEERRIAFGLVGGFEFADGVVVFAEIVKLRSLLPVIARRGLVPACAAVVAPARVAKRETNEMDRDGAKRSSDARLPAVRSELGFKEASLSPNIASKNEWRTI